MLVVNGRLTAKGKAQVGSFTEKLGLNSQMLFDEINSKCYDNDGEVVEHCREYAEITIMLKDYFRRH